MWCSRAFFILLFAFDAWCWRYLSWPDALVSWPFHFSANQSWLNQVGDRWISSAFLNLQKSTLNAICGVPEHLAILLFAFDAWLWRYLSWPEVLLEVIAFIRCLTFSSMLFFDLFCSQRPGPNYDSWNIHSTAPTSWLVNVLRWYFHINFECAIITYKSFL